MIRDLHSEVLRWFANLAIAGGAMVIAALFVGWVWF